MIPCPTKTGSPARISGSVWTTSLCAIISSVYSCARGGSVQPIARAAENKTPYYRATRLLVVNGIQQQYVDWGGTGETLLLLAGLTNDAYIFNTFAQMLNASSARAIALGPGTDSLPISVL